jgi:hypothetical protein
MITRCVSAVLLVALLALVGCKKGEPAGGDEGAVTKRAGDVDGVVLYLDELARESEQDKAPMFGPLVGDRQRPQSGAPVTLDATAGRAEIDAAFGRFWTAWEARPDLKRKALIRTRIETLTKKGTAPDKAKEEAERAFPRDPPLLVTEPTPLLDARVNRITAQVTGGTRGIWSQNGGLNVDGSVQYSELLRIQVNGQLSARLKGRAERLELHANGNLVADLTELLAPTVEVRPNGHLFLRIGPGTGTLKVDGNIVSATVLVRGKTDLKIVGADNRSPPVVVVNY